MIELIGLIAGILIIWVLWTRLFGAEWIPMPLPKIRKMLELAEVKEGDLLYDLGSGDGRIIILASKEFGARAMGIEIDPLRFLLSWILIKIFKIKAEVRLGNFFDENLSDATVVTLFLLESTNRKLKQKLRKELKPGTRVVSYRWKFDGWTPSKVDEKFKLYLYEI
jgi:SAM-dependent methyltransferase